MHSALAAYSAALGSDPLLVQGAGGNISWKDGDTLWIKASGTWLADALQRDIFVPLSLAGVRSMMAAGEESFVSAVIGASTARPSIETSLHAALPHRIVVHAHPVDVLAICARKSGVEWLADRLLGLAWAIVPYAKPGVQLTAAVSEVCKQHPAANVLILANHGLVIGGDSIEEVDALLQQVCARLRVVPRNGSGHDVRLTTTSEHAWGQHGYVPATDSRWHAMALDECAIQLARRHWVMYPDHAVFLGARATIADAALAPKDIEKTVALRPPCIFLEGVGVLQNAGITKAQRAMVQCFYDVAMRIDDAADAQSLSDAHISDLLNWDAEKYRQQHSR